MKLARRQLIKEAPAAGLFLAAYATVPRETRVATLLTGGTAAVINVKAFGAVGHGDTDDTAALIAVRDHMLADNGRAWELLFPPGTYLYSNNRIFWGVKNLTVHAYGAELKCIADKAFSRDTRPLRMWNFFEAATTDADFPGDASAGFSVGQVINTTTAGGSTVTTTTAADAANYAVGDHVLIHGYDQQGSGFPPNSRYFEYNMVTAVDAATGTITLKNKLRHTYRADWWDRTSGTITAGAARIINTRSSTIPPSEHIEIRGAKFLMNDVSSNNCSLTLDCVSHVRLVDIDATELTSVWPSMNESFIAENCDLRTVGGYVEPDKLLDVLIFRNCKLTGITSSTGVNHMVIEDGCEVTDGEFRVSPRALTIRNSRLSNIKASSSSPPFGLMQTSNNQYPISRVVIENNEIHNGLGFDTSSSASHALFNDGTLRSLTVGSVGTANEILLPKASTASEAHRDLEVGHLLVLSDGTKYGRVTSVHSYDATHIAVAGTWKSAPVAAEVWYWNLVQRIEERNNTYTGTKPRSIARLQIPLEAGQLTSEGAGRAVIPNSSLLWTADPTAYRDYAIMGMVKSVTVHIHKAYTGTSATPLLRIRFAAPGSSIIADIDLATPGSRYVDAMETIGVTPGDTLNSANCMAFTRVLRVGPIHSRGAGAALAGTSAQMPEAVVILELAPLPL